MDTKNMGLRYGKLSYVFVLTNTHQKVYVLILHFRNEKGSGTQMLPTIVSAIATGSALLAGLLLDARMILDSFTLTYLFIYF